MAPIFEKQTQAPLKISSAGGAGGGRGHAITREISMYQNWSFHRVTYLRDNNNFIINLGLIFAILILTH